MWITKEGKTRLDNRIKELEEVAKARKSVELLLEESIPLSADRRAKYMSEIALFYTSVFKEKLKHFIGLQLEELSQIGRTGVADNIIKSNINCFRLIDEWMEEKTNEHLGDLQNARDAALDGETDFINEMKNKYDN